MKYEYSYFVSYHWSSEKEHKTGFGNTNITTSEKYSKIIEIEEASKLIEKELYIKFGFKAKVIILNFILLKKEKEK